MMDAVGKQTLLNNLQQRASKDPEFREKLIREPKATLAEMLGVALPEDLTICVHQDTAHMVNIVLPPMLNGELSDADLEAVAGGFLEQLCWTNCFSCR